VQRLRWWSRAKLIGSALRNSVGALAHYVKDDERVAAAGWLRKGLEKADSAAKMTPVLSGLSMIASMGAGYYADRTTVNNAEQILGKDLAKFLAPSAQQKAKQLSGHLFDAGGHAYSMAEHTADLFLALFGRTRFDDAKKWAALWFNEMVRCRCPRRPRHSVLIVGGCADRQVPHRRGRRLRRRAYRAVPRAVPQVCRAPQGHVLPAGGSVCGRGAQRIGLPPRPPVPHARVPRRRSRPATPPRVAGSLALMIAPSCSTSSCS
jgi:hypothetical protein